MAEGMDLQIIKDDYGKTLKSTADLKTEACCSSEDVAGHLKSLLCRVHEDVRAKYYGCGTAVPFGAGGGSGAAKSCC